MNSDNFKRSEFMIGLAMSVATLIVIFGILWLGKSNIFVHGLHLKVLVQNANGLSVGDEVFYNGLKVGTITSTGITDKGILLLAKVERVKKIPVDSRFVIRDYSMIGGKVLEILPGKSNKYLESGATVTGGVTPSLGDAITQITDLSPKIDKLLDNLNQLTGTKTADNLSSTFAGLQRTIKSIDKLLNGDLKNSLSDISEFTNKNKSKLSDLIDSLNKNSAELSKMLSSSTSAAKGLDKLISNINNGKGSLGQLNTNEDLYNNLNSSVIALDSLLKDIKKNPKKYFEVKVL